MNIPLVSILVPMYGVEKFIERNAVSLMEQTYPNIEYIYVDDCSPDHSIDVLKKILEQYPERRDNVHIIMHQHNKGLAAARNTAVAAAKGEFVWHVDSDDFVALDAVEKLVCKQQEDDADIVLMELKRMGNKFSYKIRREKFGSTNDWTCAFLARKSFMSVCAGLLRRSLYTENNIIEHEGINMGEDYQTLPRITYYAKKINVIHEALYFYVVLNEDSYSNSFSMDKNIQYWRAVDVLEEFFSNKGDEYMLALEQGRVSVCLEMLRSCTMTKGNEEAFVYLRSKLMSLDSKAFVQLSIPYKVLSKLDNYSVMHWYVKILGSIKRTVLTLRINNFF
jgi:Glycosyltransferases, probably involved in cell wall biogenesis